jgi:hypothetical protein
MFTTTDKTLAAALSNLRKHPQLGIRIREIEAAGINVIIKDGRSYHPNSATEAGTPPSPDFFIHINTKGDDRLAKEKWGISGTTEENSLAHEIGHVYWQYLLKTKGAKIVAGKPAGVSSADWDSILDETTARRFDTYSRPAGTFVPLRNDPKNSAFINFLINL